MEEEIEFCSCVDGISECYCEEGCECGLDCACCFTEEEDEE